MKAINNGDIKTPTLNNIGGVLEIQDPNSPPDKIKISSPPGGFNIYWSNKNNTWEVEIAGQFIPVTNNDFQIQVYKDNFKRK